MVSSFSEAWREGARRKGPGNAQTAKTSQAVRVPPQDLEAERAVLCGLLLDNTALHSIYTELKAEDFYHPAHRVLYRAMVTVGDAGTPVDIHTLVDHLERNQLLEEVGGRVAVAEISDYDVTAANILHHARIVRDRAMRRRVIQTATSIVEMSYDADDSSDRILDNAESKIFEISRETARVTFRSLRDEMQGAFDYVEALMGRGGQLTGVPTGFRELDEKTGGLQPGDLVVLAARPSMGKTALALNIARNAAVLHRKKVAVFSLEMTAQALVLRVLAAEAELDVSRFRSGYIGVDDHRKLQQAASRLGTAELWIDDSGTITILEMKAKCRRAKANQGLDLLILDYLQLANSDRRTERREQEISEISRGLKSLAKELDIPVLALSQLNRGPEARTGRDKRPLLADLRESGAIEQDADAIFFIYRDEIYNREDESVRGLAELIIAKQRNGPVGTIELTFQSRYTRFLDRSGRGEPYPGAGMDVGGGARSDEERPPEADIAGDVPF